MIALILKPTYMINRVVIEPTTSEGFCPVENLEQILHG